MDDRINSSAIVLNERFKLEKKRLDLADRVGRFIQLPPVDEQLENTDYQRLVIELVLEKVRDLTIEGIDDTEGYAEVHEGSKILKRLNGGLTDWKKEVKAEALRYGRMVDAYSNELTAIIDQAKKVVADKMEAIDKEKARVEAERAKAEQEQYEKRYKGLIGMGMTYDGIKHHFFVEGHEDGPFLDEALVRLGDSDSLKGFIKEQMLPILPSKGELASRRISQERKQQLVDAGAVLTKSPEGWDAVWVQGKLVSIKSLYLYSDKIFQGMLDSFNPYTSGLREELAQEATKVKPDEPVVEVHDTTAPWDEGSGTDKLNVVEAHEPFVPRPEEDDPLEARLAYDLDLLHYASLQIDEILGMRPASAIIDHGMRHLRPQLEKVRIALIHLKKECEAKSPNTRTS